MSKTEIWKPVKGFEEAYEISSLGRLKSLARQNTGGGWMKERILKPTLNNTGYYATSLRKDGISWNVLIHRIVAEAFHPNPEGKEQVNHKDSDRLNNFASNLGWVTPKENTQHAVKAGRYSICKGVKRTSKDGTIETYTSIAEAARNLGSDPANLSQAVNHCMIEKQGYKIANYYKGHLWDFL